MKISKMTQELKQRKLKSIKKKEDKKIGSICHKKNNFPIFESNEDFFSSERHSKTDTNFYPKSEDFLYSIIPFKITKGLLNLSIVTEHKDLANIFKCSLCKNLVWNPKKCNVKDHLFCDFCLEDWKKDNLNEGDILNMCPAICDFSDDFEIKDLTGLEKNLLNLIEMKCPFNCGKIIKYDEIKEHYMNFCSNTKYKCFSKHCNFIGSDSEITKHVVNCPFAEINCDLCGQLELRKNMEKHINEICPNFIVKCERCEEEMRRFEYKMHYSKEDTNIKCLQTRVSKLKKYKGLYEELMKRKN